MSPLHSLEGLTLDAARDAFCAVVTPLDGVDLALDAALGYALAAPVRAALALPPFDNSAMDGYALRASDTADATRDRPAHLRLAGSAVAGHALRGRVAVGHAAAITTGAPLPVGVDAVVAQEEVTLEGERVVVREPVLAGRHVRRKGEDVAAGEEALSAGVTLGPAEIALLAALGQGSVRVTRRPRVAVLTTGDELRLPGESLGNGEIYNANRFALTAQLREAGADPVPLPAAADRPDAIASALSAALDADAVITSAGMCAGQHDHIAEALRDRGEFSSGELRLRPARHVGIGRLAGKPVFALPGNPAASLIAFELLVRPAIRRMAGHRTWRRPEVAAMLARAVVSAPGVTQALWVRLERTAHGNVALRAGAQGAGMLGPAARGNALLLVPEHVTAYPEGQSVMVTVLSGVVNGNVYRSVG